MIKVDVYLLESIVSRGEVETSLIFQSKELGWIEFFDNGLRPIHYNKKMDIIKIWKGFTYNDQLETFNKYALLTKLGEL